MWMQLRSEPADSLPLPSLQAVAPSGVDCRRFHRSNRRGEGQIGIERDGSSERPSPKPFHFIRIKTSESLLTTGACGP